MITKEKLEDYAKKLMFEMNDKEYETLQKEFDIILKQMDLIGKIEGIEEVEPMTFPYITYKATLREDEVKEKEMLSEIEVIANAKEVEYSQVRVPKVVE